MIHFNEEFTLHALWYTIFAWDTITFLCRWVKSCHRVEFRAGSADRLDISWKFRIILNVKGFSIKKRKESGTLESQLSFRKNRTLSRIEWPHLIISQNSMYSTMQFIQRHRVTFLYWNNLFLEIITIGFTYNIRKKLDMEWSGLSQPPVDKNHSTTALSLLCCVWLMVAFKPHVSHFVVIFIHIHLLLSRTE